MTPTPEDLGLLWSLVDELDQPWRRYSRYLWRAYLGDIRAMIEATPTPTPATPPPLVGYDLYLDAGNTRAGSRTWVKRVTALRPNKGNAFDMEGPWMQEDGAAPEGSLLLIGGRGGSHKNKSAHYALVQVARDASFETRHSYQEFSGTGAELIATSTERPDKQAMLDAYPALAPFAGKALASIALELAERGYLGRSPAAPGARLGRMGSMGSALPQPGGGWR